MAARPSHSWLALACLLAGPAAAQTTGAIEGRVVDAASDAPVAGALVTATSPALQGEQTTVSDAQGAFVLALLPAGSYQVEVRHDAYAPGAAKGIAVHLGRAAPAELYLLPAAMQPFEVRVSDLRPTVVLDAQGSTTVTREQLTMVPWGRDARTFEAAALAVPGVLADPYGLQIRGSSSPESSVLIDGVDVADVQYGMQGTTLLQDFVEQVEVKTGGFRAEYGRSMGGVVNAVTRTGGNDFHGSLFVNLSPFEAARHSVGGDGEAVALQVSQRYNLDLGGTLGGPIVRDRLWFFAGFAPQLVSTHVDRIIQARRQGADGGPVLGADGFATTDEVARSRYARTQTSWMFAAKLTWQPAEEHRLTLAVYGNPSRTTGPGDFTSLGELPASGVSPARVRGNESAFLFDTTTGSTDVSLLYAGRLFDRSTWVEASAGFHRQVREFDPTDVQGVPTASLLATPSVLWSERHNLLDPLLQDATTPVAQRGLAACAVRPDGFDPCPVSGYSTGGLGYHTPATAQRLAFGAKVTQLLRGAGKHQLKAGADVALDRLDKQVRFTGGSVFTSQGDGSFVAWTLTDPTAFPLDPQQLAQPATLPTRLVRGASISAFLQDAWAPHPAVVVDVGVRVERQLLYADRAIVDPSTSSTVQGAQLSLTNWMPRLGVSWDFTGRGLSRAYAALGRYYQSVPLSLAAAGLSPSPSQFGLVSGAGCGPGPLLARDPRTCRGIGSLGALGLSPSLVDPGLQGQYLDEFQAGVQLQPLRETSLGLEYVHRAVGRIVEDSFSDPAAVWITNPGAEGSKVPMLLPDGSTATPSRRYDALTLSLNKAFGRGTLLGASYTLSSLRGNYPGLFARENGGQVMANTNSTADSWIYFVNAEGPLDGDTRHAFKVHGAWSVQLDARTTLQLGAAFRAQEGAPINYISGWNNLAVLFLLPRGAGGRLPWVAQLDARAGVSRELAGGLSLGVSLEAFNLLNAQAATAADQTYTLQDAVPLSSVAQLPQAQGCTRQADFINCTPNGQPLLVNPRWGQTTAYQLPFSLRLGARLGF